MRNGTAEEDAGWKNPSGMPERARLKTRLDLVDGDGKVVESFPQGAEVKVLAVRLQDDPGYEFEHIRTEVKVELPNGDYSNFWSSELEPVRR